MLEILIMALCVGLVVLGFIPSFIVHSTPDTNGSKGTQIAWSAIIAWVTMLLSGFIFWAAISQASSVSSALYH
jgi:hypothetical protein